MERLYTSKVSISNGNIKYPIGKSVFAVNLQLKLFPATVASADIGSLKSLHTFLKKCLYHMLVTFEQNRMVKLQEIYFEFFDKKQTNKQTKTKNNNNNKKQNKTKQNKNRFLKTILTQRWRHFGRRFCSWNNCLMLNY